MRTGISRRWAAAIGAAVVLGVSGLGVWSANADTTETTNTDSTWTVDGSTQTPQDVEARIKEAVTRLNDSTWV
jgi:hypothetical protein